MAPQQSHIAALEAGGVRAVSIRLADAFLHHRPMEWKHTDVLTSGTTSMMRHKGAAIATHLVDGIQFGFHGMINETVLDRLNALSWLAFGYRRLFRMELGPVYMGGSRRPNYNRNGAAIYLGNTEIRSTRVYTIFYPVK